MLAPESSAPEDLAECFDCLIPLPNGTKIPMDLGPQFKTYFLAQFRYFNAFDVEVCRELEWIRDILIEFTTLFPSQAMEWAHPRRKSGAAGVAIDQALRPPEEAPP